jgi:hypothetical protein
VRKTLLPLGSGAKMNSALARATYRRNSDYRRLSKILKAGASSAGVVSIGLKGSCAGDGRMIPMNEPDAPAQRIPN